MKNYLKQLIQSRPTRMINYAEYIAAALYHPEKGYYMKEGEKIGRNGDFITSSNISDIYGRAVANWYRGLIKDYGLPAAVCEIGAGSGRFAKAFVDEWQKLDGTLQYYILEKSPYHLKKQNELLAVYSNVIQINSLGEIAPFEGMVFSNELFDALPVHVIEKANGIIHEIMVTVNDNELSEQKMPLENKQIKDFLHQNSIGLSEGQRIEIPLEMERMICGIAAALQKGLVVTVDYGYTNEEWKEPFRKEGSLRGYFKHNLVHNVLQYPGEMDITSHIHLDALISEGEKQGLRLLAKQRQDEFLLSIGLLKELEENFDPDPFSAISKRNRAIRSLIMPGGISSAFHVIIQHKNLRLSDEQLFRNGIK